MHYYMKSKAIQVREGRCPGETTETLLSARLDSKLQAENKPVYRSDFKLCVRLSIRRIFILGESVHENINKKNACACRI